MSLEDSIANNKEAILKIKGEEIYFEKPKNPIKDESLKKFFKYFSIIVTLTAFAICLFFWAFTKR